MKIVSFIIPTYHRISFLIQAIESIRRQIQVQWKPEIIVIDDDPESTLKEELCRQDQLQIIYLKNKINSGPGFSRQEGLKLAKGELIVFMDDDDFFTDFSCIEKAIRIFNDNKNADLSFVGFNANSYYQKTGRIQKNQPLNLKGLISGKTYFKGFMGRYNKPISTFTSVFSHKKLLESGAAKVEMLNDTVIYLLASSVGNVFFNSEYIGNYRIHNSNISETLSAEFIIDNIETKIALLGHINRWHSNRTVWIYNQAKVSIRYFLQRNDNLSQAPIIFDWIGRQRLVLKVILRLDTLFFWFKRRIKNFLLVRIGKK
ncbi:glycosyltransferase family 2 protein [Oenococcus oeni]|uniref:glycosyltransferase family 2 protein n=1 Tax=Oenococcus oeni TaxID=1247 RepID=UPI0010B1683A|nr:glycosyltransferase family A protein [Oenococcus oeni]SYW09688.1 putative Epsk [Oenococcus oeni]